MPSCWPGCTVWRPTPSPGSRCCPRLDDSARALDDAYRFLSTAVTKDCAGSGVGRLAARQPSRRPGSGPRDPSGPPAQVPTRNCRSSRRSVRRISAGLCVRARADRAHRRPSRSADARRFRRRLSAGRAADDRRDLGDRDHAAARPGRRVAAARGRCRRRAPQPRSRARVGRSARHQHARPRTGRRARCCATKPPAARASRRRSSSSSLHWLRDQPSSAAPAWHALQRALEAQDDSPDEMLRARAPARSGRTARHRQHHHDDAAAVLDRLAALLRARQPRRADPPRGSGGCVRSAWISRPAIGTGTRSSSWRAAPSRSEQNVARSAVDLAAAAQHDVAIARSHPSRRLLPHLARTLPARARGPLSADAAGSFRPLLLRTPGARLPRHDCRRHGAGGRRASSLIHSGTAARRSSSG